MSVLPSAKFLQIYDGLSPEAQRELVETHLGTVLDAAPRSRAKRALSTAVRLRRTQTAIPVVNFRAKKRELNALLDALTRDAKCAFVKERSNRAELVEELLDSIGAWLGDIWIAVYEHHSHFGEAHKALLFISEIVDKLNDGSRVGGCPCATKSYEFDFTIRDQTRKEIERFQFHGCHKLSSVLLWMWRELFVSMSVAMGRRARAQIADMLQDIDDELGWRSLVDVLHGGAKMDDEEEARNEWEDTDGEDDDEEEEEEEEEEVEVQEKIGGKKLCHCDLHGTHWTSEVNDNRLPIRRLVKDHLRNLFSIAPSEPLYTALLHLGCLDLLPTLSGIAGSSSDNLAAALEIYTIECDSAAIMTLLDTHSDLLRPRDALTLQGAMLTVCTTSLRTKTLPIVEREMLETVHSVATCVRGSFCRIDDPRHSAELARILKLPHASVVRAERIEQWVDAVVTPSSAPLHAVAFAAMMMGIPAPGIEEGEDPDFLGHLDLDPNDPDLEELREELRPPLGERFDGWVEVLNAPGMKNGGALVGRVYTKMVEVMPFLKAQDVVDAMQARVADRPSKQYISDALGTLSSFAKMHRKRMSLRAEKKRKAANPTPAAAPVHISLPVFTFASLAGNGGGAGAGDDDDDGPPPLEPIYGNGNTSDDDGPPPLEPVGNGSVPSSNFSFSFAPPPMPMMPPPAGHPFFGGIDDVD